MERDLLDSRPLGITCFIFGRFINFIEALITIQFFFFKYKFKCRDVAKLLFFK